MSIAQYLDSTYLKTPAQSGLTEEATKKIVFDLCDEALANHIFAVMIRPDYVKEVKTYLAPKGDVKVGTVIGFHEGTHTVEEKLAEAQKAIEDGADELDYVINFEAYKAGDLDTVKREVVEGSKLGLENGKVVKWIIEIAALTNAQIEGITTLIRQCAEEHFTPEEQAKIFVKSSTGFFKTEDGKPNGATVEGIKLMKANSGALPIKAAGGVRTPEEAQEMIALGVTRIGTSSALALLKGETTSGGY